MKTTIRRPPPSWKRTRVVIVAAGAVAAATLSLGMVLAPAAAATPTAAEDPHGQLARGKALDQSGRDTTLARHRALSALAERDTTPGPAPRPRRPRPGGAGGPAQGAVPVRAGHHRGPAPRPGRPGRSTGRHDPPGRPCPWAGRGRARHPAGRPGRRAARRCRGHGRLDRHHPPTPAPAGRRYLSRRPMNTVPRPANLIQLT